MTDSDPDDRVDLSGHVVLLVGAAPALRSAFAKGVLARGGRIAVAVTRPWQVQALEDELGSAGVMVGTVGPRDGEAAAGFVKGVEDALGKITALVFVSEAATGGIEPTVAVGADAAGDLGALLESNLLAGATVVRALVGRLRRRRRGHVLLIGATEQGRGANLAASLAALRGYATGLAHELQGSGVTVTARFDDGEPSLDAAFACLGRP